MRAVADAGAGPGVGAEAGIARVVLEPTKWRDPYTVAVAAGAALNHAGWGTPLVGPAAVHAAAQQAAAAAAAARVEQHGIVSAKMLDAETLFLY